MVTKSRGPLREDIRRIIGEAKRAGLANVVIHVGQTAIVMPLDGTYVEKLAPRQPPVPDVKPAEEEHNWKNW